MLWFSSADASRTEKASDGEAYCAERRESVMWRSREVDECGTWKWTRWAVVRLGAVGVVDREEGEEGSSTMRGLAPLESEAKVEVGGRRRIWVSNSCEGRSKSERTVGERVSSGVERRTSPFRTRTFDGPR